MSSHQRLMKARKQNGFTSRTTFYAHLQKHKMDISYTRLGAIERGSDPTIKEINILCKMLKMSADWWLTDDPAPAGVIKKRVDQMAPESRIRVLEFMDALRETKPLTRN